LRLYLTVLTTRNETLPLTFQV